MSSNEMVVAVRAESVTFKDGFTPIEGTPESIWTQFTDILKPEELVIGARHWIEKDEKFLQLIPSIVFRKPDSTVLHYQRVKNSGESRLLGNYTVVHGGHVNIDDIQLRESEINVAQTICENISRELKEELGIDLDDESDERLGSLNFKGFIYDSSNNVGRVHLGILFVCDVVQDCEFDDEVAESEGMLLKGWYSPETLSHHNDIDVINLENWAKIVLEYLA